MRPSFAAFSRKYLSFAVAVMALAFGAAAAVYQTQAVKQAGQPRALRALTAWAHATSGGTTASARAGAEAAAAIPENAHLNGTWSSVKSWPLIGIHLVLLPDGRVLSYGTNAAGAATGYFIYDIWTPSEGFGSDAHLTLPNTTKTDTFCSSQLLLPQEGAGVVINGGDRWDGTKTTHFGNNGSTLFNYNNNTLTRQSKMFRQRFYSAATTLPNGEMYVQGGKGGEDRPEVRQLDGTYRLLDNINTSAFVGFYPRNFVAPDGRVFGWEQGGQMYYMDPSGTGTMTKLSRLAANYQGANGSAAMFRPGRILEVGEHTRVPIVIDITRGTPVITPADSISAIRIMLNSTVLADGKVLLTGGSGVENELIDITNQAEIWDPETGDWHVGSKGALARLYHSTALLLPDATVLVAGGGAKGPLTNLNAEIYTPPYLFDSSDQLAARAEITAAPSTLEIGKSFRVDYTHSRAIDRVALVKTGSVTHLVNMDQRFVDLPFSLEGNRLRVQMPARSTDTPPGYYMLFLIDDKGVPSKAKILFINVAGSTPAQRAPVLTEPGNQTNEVGDTVQLDLQATDPDGDTLTFSATGLPPGLSLDPATGRIGGVPTKAGRYTTNVVVDDGELNDSAGFRWTVSVPEGPFDIDSIPTPVPTAVGAATGFSARASGNGVEYKWSFDDGSPDSEWSSSGDISHTFANPGVYFVTVSARDSSGARAQETVVQVVHLPLTTNRPTASSNVAYESRTGGGRVWVVNQDSNSVSVFDAQDGTKRAEIAVKSAPRSVAVASDGKIWVTNKRSAAISVIDSDSLSVVANITLPRGSQPHGLAMSPVGHRAYVALEASGSLLPIDTSSYQFSARILVGPNPRHLSVSSDGATVYASRYITRPQPGENTGEVGSSLDGEPTGGEVVRVRTSDGAVLGTTVLRHSDRPDSETQGRGVPNYLGAPVVSPDGTQAWVPSKQDNVLRGILRDGNPLNFENTVRAVVSRIDLSTGLEQPSARVDLDNAGLASAATFDRYGVILFVALETSREVLVMDAHRRRVLFRFDVGRAPDGLALSSDGLTLYVNNFMDRTLGVFDLTPLFSRGQLKADAVATPASVQTELLSAQVLRGKQLFYDARDPRLAADAYMSCATCHNDGGHDGRTWDLTGFGEGLRNTINLRGHAGAEGFLHWSNNFDEVQDFEGQIRALAGGTGLMDDDDFAVGTRQNPLGMSKAGISADLDALAAYVKSLATFDRSPFRNAKGKLTAKAAAGKLVFQSSGCVGCHSGAGFTNSGANTLVDIGTVKPASGKRLGETLTGIDVPTLRDVWSTAPYLHDGSAQSLEDAILAHTGVSVAPADLGNLVAYVNSIGGEEPAPKPPRGAGVGLHGEYFNNETLADLPVLTRTEAVNFSWTESPGPGVASDHFSVRWTGSVRPAETGAYRFRTQSNDGVRLWVNGNLVIDNWVPHAKTASETTALIDLVAGQPYEIRMEFYDVVGSAVARLLWLRPGTTGYAVVPVDRLFPE